METVEVLEVAEAAEKELEFVLYPDMPETTDDVDAWRVWYAETAGIEYDILTAGKS